MISIVATHSNASHLQFSKYERCISICVKTSVPEILHLGREEDRFFDFDLIVNLKIPGDMADKETDISWALKLLTVDPDQEQSVLGNCGATVAATAAGFVTAIFVNYASRRPIWSGIQKHLTFPIIFGCGVRYWEVRGQEKNAERDAVFRHYITLHPEDFPEPARRKYSEILDEWIPIR